MSEEILEALTSHPNWEVMNPIGDNPEPNLEDPAVAGWMWHTIKVQLPKGSVIRRLWSKRGESVSIQLSGNVVINTRRGRHEWKGVTPNTKDRSRNKDKVKKAEEDVERLPIGQALHVGGDVRAQS